jgi:hypothetical protein
VGRVWQTALRARSPILGLVPALYGVLVNWWLFPTSLPSIVLGHIVFVLSFAIGLTRKPRYRDRVLTAEWRPWFAKIWRYSTTVGHFIGRHPRHGARTWAHELVHTRQYVNLCLLSAVISGVLVAIPNYGLSWIEGLILWGTSGAAWLLPNYLTGWIRYGDAYRGSEHERSAYAQTDDL